MISTIPSWSSLTGFGVKLGQLEFEQNHSILSEGTKHENNTCYDPGFNC